MSTASVFAFSRRRPVAYALATVPVGLVTLLKLRVDWIGRDAPVAIYLGAIMFVAWLGGTGPGLVATFLSLFAGMYFFAAPYDSLAVASGDDAARILLASVEGTFISLLAGALRRTSEDLARQVRERTRAEEPHSGSRTRRRFTCRRCARLESSPAGSRTTSTTC